MIRNAKWAPGSGLELLGSDCRDGRWTISALGKGSARCPGCDAQSTRLHGWQVRPTMRALAMRFSGIPRGGDVEKLTAWLHDADRSALYGIRRFAQTLKLDLAAVRNAITETWSNGQTEGQINRLKMLKRAMYGRAGADLLRVRMIPPAPSRIT